MATKRLVKVKHIHLCVCMCVWERGGANKQTDQIQTGLRWKWILKGEPQLVTGPKWTRGDIYLHNGIGSDCWHTIRCRTSHTHPAAYDPFSLSLSHFSLFFWKKIMLSNLVFFLPGCDVASCSGKRESLIRKSFWETKNSEWCKFSGGSDAPLQQNSTPEAASGTPPLPTSLLLLIWCLKI